jgi:hypothetical protein
MKVILNVMVCSILSAVMGLMSIGAQHVAAAPILTSDGTGSLRNDSSNTLGFQFTVGAANVYVTALGFWDGPATGSGGGTLGGNGLNVDHQVGLWTGNHTVAGTLVASVNVLADLSNSTLGADGEFRYVTLGSAVMLTAGQTYTLGAKLVSGSGDTWHDVSAITFSSPDFTSVLARYEDTGAIGLFAKPRGNLTTPSTAYVGPNFLYQLTEPVPEPSSFSALAIGTLVLGFVRRRHISQR